MRNMCDNCYNMECPIKEHPWMKAHEVVVSSCNMRENISVKEAKEKANEAGRLA